MHAFRIRLPTKSRRRERPAETRNAFTIHRTPAVVRVGAGRRETFSSNSRRESNRWGGRGMWCRRQLLVRRTPFQPQGEPLSCRRACKPTVFDRLPAEGGATHRVPALLDGAPRERAYKDCVQRCRHDDARYDRIHCDQVRDHVEAGGNWTDQERERESDSAHSNDRPLKPGHDSSRYHRIGSAGTGGTRRDGLLGARRRHVKGPGRLGTGNRRGHLDDSGTRHCRDCSDRNSHRDDQQGETDRNGLLSIH